MSARCRWLLGAHPSHTASLATPGTEWHHGPGMLARHHKLLLLRVLLCHIPRNTAAMSCFPWSENPYQKACFGLSERCSQGLVTLYKHCPLWEPEGRGNGARGSQATASILPTRDIPRRSTRVYEALLTTYLFAVGYSCSPECGYCRRTRESQSSNRGSLFFLPSQHPLLPPVKSPAPAETPPCRQFASVTPGSCACFDPGSGGILPLRVLVTTPPRVCGLT